MTVALGPSGGSLMAPVSWGRHLHPDPRGFANTSRRMQEVQSALLLAQIPGAPLHNVECGHPQPTTSPCFLGWSQARTPYVPWGPFDCEDDHHRNCTSIKHSAVHKALCISHLISPALCPTGEQAVVCWRQQLWACGSQQCPSLSRSPFGEISPNWPWWGSFPTDISKYYK